MSEDVRPFEEYKEMIEDMTKDNMIRGLYDLSKRVTDLLNEKKKLEKELQELKHIMYVIRDDNGLNHLWCKDMILDWLGSDAK